DMVNADGSNARTLMSFDKEENSNTKIDILANSKKVELPKIEDLLDINSDELAFESSDTIAITKESSAATGFSGASEPEIAVDFTTVQALNDNMQTEATFHII
ncbi:hypothetical protein ACT3QR_08710, partial [Psychrobacter sp. AOP7-B1-25]|uniref:hypothetical protein n=1 Tax=Psychrobacter sp. AOP7-B1-25 TaxID=3457644 RepID=UPI00402BABCD